MTFKKIYPDYQSAEEVEGFHLIRKSLKLRERSTRFMTVEDFTATWKALFPFRKYQPSKMVPMEFENNPKSDFWLQILEAQIMGSLRGAQVDWTKCTT